MRIAIIGYGKLGHEIEKAAIERGHSIELIIDKDNADELDSEHLESVDVAIEFTTPGTAVTNISTCLKSGIPVVSGTTGWLEQWDEMVRLCNEKGGALFYASNYSIGVNILFAVNTQLAEIMNDFPQYRVSVEEIHHVHKLDAPSGTAISLAEQIIEKSPAKKNWSLDTENPDTIRIDAKREGEVNGFHKILYDSEVDTIEISHNAKSRKGFANGAVMAAEFLAGKSGVFGMKDMLKL